MVLLKNPYSQKLNKRPRRARTEQYLQQACVQFMANQYPKVLCVHTPNGGIRDKGTARILKGMGVVAGFPDLFIYKPNVDFHGLAIELKSQRGKPTANQLAIKDRLENAGYKYKIVRDVSEFIKEVENYLSKKF